MHFPSSFGRSRLFAQQLHNSSRSQIVQFVDDRSRLRENSRLRLGSQVQDTVRENDARRCHSMVQSARIVAR